LEAALTLTETLPVDGLGLEATAAHLLRDVTPGLNASSLSSHYYGFVVGGVTPAAQIADAVVSTYDQNVHVHLPKESVASTVEDRALVLLMDLLGFEKAVWRGRTLTTGATASNVLGLACGREWVVNRALKRAEPENPESPTVGEIGLLAACLRAKVATVQVLTTMPHSSLVKAASVVGIGRANVKNVGQTGGMPWLFDHQKLEAHLAIPGSVSIVAISCGEVNTGRFATTGVDEMRRIRALCDSYGAWLHVDGGKY
jgi:glutamate/tyrosine decarboxylase-like PLP-dependent enzyme